MRKTQHTDRSSERRRRHVSDIFGARYASRKKAPFDKLDREQLPMSRPRDVSDAPQLGLTRRELVRSLGAGVGALAIGAAAAEAQAPGPVAPPSTITSPPRDFG